MTDKVIFRELNKEDVNTLFKIYSDKEAMKYRGSKSMETLEDASTYIKNRRAFTDKTLTVRKGIELVSTNELIGSVMYRYDRRSKDECEIGYSLGRQFWRKGLGKEIVKLMIQEIDENRLIKRVVAWSNKENIASIRILTKLGFHRVEQSESQPNDLYHKEMVNSKMR